MRRIVLGIFASGWLFGCAHQSYGENHVGIQAAATTGVQASLTDAGMYGPDVNIGRVASGYRGQSLGQPVDLTWSPDRVRGIVGAGPVDLFWENTPEGLWINGLYSGHISDIVVGDVAIRGTLGECTYDMVRDGPTYRGFQQCNTIMQRNSELELPPNLIEREPGDRVALLSLVLGGYRPGAGAGLPAEFRPPPPPRHWRLINGVYQLPY
jgi:hypothetical protein